MYIGVRGGGDGGIGGGDGGGVVRVEALCEARWGACGCARKDRRNFCARRWPIRVCALVEKKSKLNLLPARPFTALEACIPRKGLEACLYYFA